MQEMPSSERRKTAKGRCHSNVITVKSLSALKRNEIVKDFWMPLASGLGVSSMLLVSLP